MPNWNQVFKEQFNFFKSKGLILNPNKWDKIASEVHARAFTVAHVANMDIVKDIREAMEKAIERGETVSQFKKRLPDIMERKGWTGVKNPYRLDNIYRTNLADSYNVGRYTQQIETKISRPYWRYMAVMDSRTRDAHAKMNGRVYRANSPIWLVWYPPNGFQCRCYVRSMSEDQLQKSGFKIQTDTGGLLPDDGWQINTAKQGLSAWQPNYQYYTIAERWLLKNRLIDRKTDTLIELERIKERKQLSRASFENNTIDETFGGLDNLINYPLNKLRKIASYLHIKVKGTKDDLIKIIEKRYEQNKLLIKKE